MELDKFAAFIRRHHVMTLATVGGGVEPAGCPVYCSHAFYCYDTGRNLFVIAASHDTHHAQQMADNHRVAFGVALESRVIGRLQGLQACGSVRPADDEAQKAYLRRFPYAALTELTLWIVEPGWMKLTDNTLGFGKKLVWKAGEGQ